MDNKQTTLPFALLPHSKKLIYITFCCQRLRHSGHEKRANNNCIAQGTGVCLENDYNQQRLMMDCRPECDHSAANGNNTLEKSPGYRILPVLMNYDLQKTPGTKQFLDIQLLDGSFHEESIKMFHSTKVNIFIQIFLCNTLQIKQHIPGAYRLYNILLNTY
ncbi:uncharacterized protein V6R79_019729 [Siganus canaliculatus]